MAQRDRVTEYLEKRRASKLQTPSSEKNNTGSRVEQIFEQRNREIVAKNAEAIAKRYGDWEKSYNSGLGIYNNKFTEGYGKQYDADAQSWYDTNRNSYTANTAAANTILKDLAANEKYLNPEWVSAIRKNLEQGIANNDQILKAAEETAKYFSGITEDEFKQNMADEDAYRAYVESGGVKANLDKLNARKAELISHYDKAWDDFYNAIYGSQLSKEEKDRLYINAVGPNPEIKSEEGRRVEKTRSLINDINDQIAIEEQKYRLYETRRKAEELVGNIDPAKMEELIGLAKESESFKGSITYYRDNPQFIEAKRKLDDESFTGNWLLDTMRFAAYMTNEQYNNYLAIYGQALQDNGGDKIAANEVARAYLDYLKPSINSQAGADYAKRHNAVKTAIVSGLDQFGTGLTNALLTPFIDVDTTQSALQYASQAERENLGKVSGFFYDVLNTGANMLPSMLVGLANPTAGAALMGVSAGGNAATEMLRLGYSKGQALTYGALIGASETLLEKFMGGIPVIGGGADKLANLFLGKIDNAIARFAITVGAQGFSEFTEESIQEILEPWFRSVVTKTDFEAPNADEVLYAGLLGLASSVLSPFGIAGNVATAKRQTSAGKAVQRTGQLQGFIKEGLTMPEGTQERRLAEEITAKQNAAQKVSNSKAGLLAQKISQKGVDVAPTGQVDGYSVRARLEGKGVENASEIGGIITDYLNTGNITKKNRRTLVNNKAAMDVLNEFRNDRSIRIEPPKAQEAQTVAQDNAGDDSAPKATDNVSQEENRPQLDLNVSGDGKTRLISTGEEVGVKELLKITKDGATVKLTDGREVDTTDVEFADADTAESVSTLIGTRGMTSVAANSLLKAYSPKMGVSLPAYVATVAASYENAVDGLDALTPRANWSEALTQAAYDAYERGKIHLKSEEEARKKRRTDAIRKSLNKGISDGQSKVIKFGEAFGVKVGFIDTKKVDGFHSDGFVDKETGTIYVDKNTTDPLAFVLKHEFTHFAERSGAKYAAFQKAVLNSKSFDAWIRKQAPDEKTKAACEEAYKKGIADRYAKYGIKADPASEMIANYVGDVLFTKSDADVETLIKQMTEGLTSKESNVVTGFVRDFIAWVKSKAQKLGLTWDDVHLQRLFAESFVAATNTAFINQTESELHKEGIGFDADTESVYSIPFSPATIQDVEAREQKVDELASTIAKMTHRSKADALKWVRAEMSIVNTILSDPDFMSVASYDPDARYEAIKKNSDYPQGTVDFTNLCPKRKEFTKMFDMLQKLYPSTLFTASDVAAMRKVLSAHDIVVACGLCFVEDRRQLLGEIAETFQGMWRTAVNTSTPLQKTNAKGDKVTMRVTKKIASLYKDAKQGTAVNATDTYIPTQYDLTTYAGFKALQANHPQIAMAYEMYNNSRGQQAGRLIEGRGEYKRQILEWTDAKVKSVNDNGGLRIFSFSDFEVEHLVDLVQVILDCSARGVKIQGYTKIPEFAKLIRNTGIKLNRSLIPAGKTGLKVVNGKKVLAYDNVEGMNMESESFLDEEDNPNVGNIIIGINDEQIRVAMADDFIDYIIPFHTNKSKGVCTQLGLEGWINYKESQHDKKDGKAAKHNVNIYTEVIAKYNPQNKVEFVERFLEVCKAKGIEPRFSQFLDKNANGDYVYTEGYHKFLVDFKLFDKQGNILLQMEITPDLDEGFMKELIVNEAQKLKDYKFDQEVFDTLVENFGEPNAVKQVDDGRQYSIPLTKDTDGKKLSPEQAEYFKDSKVRDKKGNLKVMYHGTPNGGFHIFDPSTSDDKISLFFTDSPDVATTYSGDTRSYAPYPGSVIRGTGNYKVYLNIKNPLVVDVKGRFWNEISKEYSQEVADRYSTLTQEEKEALTKLAKKRGKNLLLFRNDINIALGLQERGLDGGLLASAYSKLFEGGKYKANIEDLHAIATNKFSDKAIGKYALRNLTTRDFAKMAKPQEYDGVIFKNVIDTGKFLSKDEQFVESTVAIAFDSNQIKSVANKTPTADPDIRYSIPDETKEQRIERLDKALDGHVKVDGYRVYRHTSKTGATASITIITPDGLKFTNFIEDASNMDDAALRREAAKFLEAEMSKPDYEKILDLERAEYGTIPPTSTAEVDARVPKKVGDGSTKVRSFARQILEKKAANDAEWAEDTKRRIANGELSYEPQSDANAMRFAKSVGDFSELYNLWQKIKDEVRGSTKNGIAVGELLLQKAIERADGRLVNEVSSELAVIFTNAGQVVQAAKMFHKMTGIGMLMTFQREVNRLNKKYKNANIKIGAAVAEKLAEAKTPEEVDDAISTVVADIAEQTPATLLDKINAWRYMSMLINLKTHLRNLVGNALFLPLVVAKDAVGAIAETGLVNQSERTKSLWIRPEYWDFAKQDYQDPNVKKTLNVAQKYNEGTAIEKEKQIFKTRWLEALRKFNGEALSTEDAIFKSMHYRRALAGFLQARGVDISKPVDENIMRLARDYAVNEALKGTYNDVNALAQWLNKQRSKRLAAQIVVDSVIPFRQTPLNIVKRSASYSPIGFVTTLAQSAAQYKQAMEAYEEAIKRGETVEKPKLINAAGIDSASSALVGTTLTVMGMLFAALGWATGGMEGDEEDKFRILNGEQEYAIKIGDFSYTLDWAAPESVAFFIGVELQKIFEQKDITFADGLDVALNSFEPMLNMTMLTGITSLVKTFRYANDSEMVSGIVLKSVQNYTAQFLPSFFGSITQIIDPVRRKNFTKDSWLPNFVQNLGNTALSKSILFSNARPAYIDAWGRREVNTGAGRVLEPLLSVGYQSTVSYDDVNEEILRIYSATDDSGVFPNRSDSVKYVTTHPEGWENMEAEKRRKNLTGEEWETYATVKGQESYKLVAAFMNSDVYAKLSDAERASVISRLYGYAGEKARMEVTGEDAVKNYKTANNIELSAAEEGQDPELAVVEYYAEAKIADWYSYSNLEELFDKADYKAANELIKESLEYRIQNYIDNGEKKKDAESKATSSVKSTVTKYWKEKYLEANKAKDSSEMARIRQILWDTGLYDRKSDVITACRNWIKNTPKN
jgi:hypothetical protein